MMTTTAPYVYFYPFCLLSRRKQFELKVHTFHLVVLFLQKTDRNYVFGKRTNNGQIDTIIKDEREISQIRGEKDLSTKFDKVQCDSQICSYRKNYRNLLNELKDNESPRGPKINHQLGTSPLNPPLKIRTGTISK